MSDDQITDLARLLSADPAPDLPADRLQILKEHLMVEYRLAAGNDRPAHSTSPIRPARSSGRPRRRLLAAVGAGGLLAAAGATALVLVLSAGQPAPASPAAMRLLAEVAVAAGQQPAPPVSNSEFMYIKSEVAFAMYVDGGGTGTMQPLHERQIWLPVANICDYGLLIEEGQRTSLAPGDGLGPPAGTNCGPGNLGDPTYRLLQSLPTDPRALLHRIEAFDQANDIGQALGPDAQAFVSIGEMIRETIVPPAAAAALYRAAALIPGVTFIGHVTNADGRPGVAIAWTGRGDRYEWIFDPVTLQFTGERDFDVSTGKPVVTGDTAILQRAFVGKAGQVP
jgi:hypothetical protein